MFRARSRIVTEPGFFEAFYASAWQHPVALWLAALAGAAVCLARRDLDPSLRRYVLALTALSLADAWLTSTHVCGIGTLPASVATAVSFCFVYAGDLRYLLLWETATPGGAIALTARGLARAAVLALLVPLFAKLVTAGQDVRVLYFVYELSFCALALALLRWHPNARALPWVRSVSRFVLLYYGLWASADAILLATGSDLGYALRVIPNLLYYGGLIAAIALLAPRRSVGETH
jgi:hypothetical protein